MDTKLTVKLEQDIIEKAKEYAKSHNTSLSSLIENYLQKIISNNKEETITPLVKSLSGIIKLPSNFNVKKEYTNFISDKYK